LFTGIVFKNILIFV